MGLGGNAQQGGRGHIADTLQIQRTEVGIKAMRLLGRHGQQPETDAPGLPQWYLSH